MGKGDAVMSAADLYSIYLPIMSNPCWVPRHMRINLQEY